MAYTTLCHRRNYEQLVRHMNSSSSMCSSTESIKRFVARNSFIIWKSNGTRICQSSQLSNNLQWMRTVLGNWQRSRFLLDQFAMFPKTPYMSDLFDTSALNEIHQAEELFEM
jgi:hypothetical protein